MHRHKYDDDNVDVVDADAVTSVAILQQLQQYPKPCPRLLQAFQALGSTEKQRNENELPRN